ncbi:Sec-independent protein translocase subunit TatA [Nocardia sp. NPDC088792]|uniref:Sec-independent protein translocase subunit TatA n=1 Tax=Nocardia sp. NPDC088792 TaxID=3364332 RepID=UPI0038254FEE
MTGAISPWHLLIVVLIFLLFFGSKRMPDAARSLGRSMRIFKSEVSQMSGENSSAGQAAPEAQAQPPVQPQQLPPAQPPAAPAAAPQPNDQHKA